MSKLGSHACSEWPSYEDVCDTLGFDDECCTVADLDADTGPVDDMFVARWQYVEIALGFNYDVILQGCDVLWSKNPVEVGTDGQCSPRHQTQFESSFLVPDGTR